MNVSGSFETIRPYRNAFIGTFVAAMADGGEVEQDLSRIHWSWPEAIAASPARSLATPELALDYFAYSPFWDTKSNNNVLRTQRRVENPSYGHAEEKFELNAFRSGFEYVIAHSQPPDLFLIHRREVQQDGSRANVSAVYFVLEGKIYPTPTLYDVMATRLKNAAHLVSSTFSTLSAVHPPANPRATSQWRSLAPAAQPAARSAETGAPTTANTPAPDVDVSMDTVPPPEADAKKGKPSQPDWHLSHALQTTRTSLAELDKMARSPAPSQDPVAELRAIEAQVMGTQRTTSVTGQIRDGRTSAVSSPSVRFNPVASVGRAPSVSVAASPLTTMWSAPQ